MNGYSATAEGISCVGCVCLEAQEYICFFCCCFVLPFTWIWTVSVLFVGTKLFKNIYIYSVECWWMCDFFFLPFFCLISKINVELQMKKVKMLDSCIQENIKMRE